jgi:hypothetical protein
MKTILLLSLLTATVVVPIAGQPQPKPDSVLIQIDGKFADTYHVYDMMDGQVGWISISAIDFNRVQAYGGAIVVPNRSDNFPLKIEKKRGRYFVTIPEGTANTCFGVAVAI